MRTLFFSLVCAVLPALWPSEARCGELELAVDDPRLATDGGLAPPPPPRLVPTDLEPATTPRRDWEDRSGWTWEVGVGSLLGGVGAASDRESRLAELGGLVVFGAHHLSRSEGGGGDEKFTWPVSQGLRWCAPIGCLVPLLMLFAPDESLIGNELGFDFRVAASTSLRAPGTTVDLSVHPVFRDAHGATRTGTWLGVMVPETGVVVDPARASLALRWSLYPIDVLLDGRHLALAMEPVRIGLRIPFDGTPVASEIGTELSFRWVR
jgi:hypothetical protein